MATVQTVNIARQYYCEKCKKTMSENRFFSYRNGEKCELCKACITMHVNNWEPETYTWILEKFDVPYVPEEWIVLRDREYAKDPYKITGLSVIGKYLAKMRLKKWMNYTYADSERLQEESKRLAEELGSTDEVRAAKLENMRRMYELGEISAAQYKTYEETLKLSEFERGNGGGNDKNAKNNAYPQNNHPYEEVDIPSVSDQLTAEDKVYLAMKWGRLYSADEWVSLEKLYEEFMNSFDIQSAAAKDSLVMLCKTSLKMNQAIDGGDIDSYKKLSGVYESMMKSNKFTEAQKKEEEVKEVDSVGAIVALCEKEGGFIPRFPTDIPQDQVDVVIQDQKRYTRSLIDGDPSLGQQIEQYIRKKEILEEQKRNRELAKVNGEEVTAVSDSDYIDYLNRINDERERDDLFAKQQFEEEEDY